MALLVALLLAVFVLPSHWGVVAVVVGAAIEGGEAWLWLRLSRRRRAVTGVEGLVGSTATVTAPCRPDGQVRVHGELWQARCPDWAEEGAAVEVVAIDGLTLTLRPKR